MLIRRKLFHIALGGLVALSLSGLPVFPQSSSEEESPIGVVSKDGVEVDIRSLGRSIADDVSGFGTSASDAEISPVPGLEVVPQVQFRGGNVQINASILDNIQSFAGQRPFVLATQSEPSIAGFAHRIVAAYNTTAKQSLAFVCPFPLTCPPGNPALVFTARSLSGFSTSTDGGGTWTSGFLPPVPGEFTIGNPPQAVARGFTLGDPVLAVGRGGKFYFAGLGALIVPCTPSSTCPLGFTARPTIQVNTSIDRGLTWGDAVVVQQDNLGDKPWIAVGRDPLDGSRDNVYVTWTSLRTGTGTSAVGAKLNLGRSLDGGLTWTTKPIFTSAKDTTPANPQDMVSFSVPYVEPITGRLYIPFLHFSAASHDFIRILISDDAGETFTFATFNILPDPTLLPVVTAGELTNCGSSGGTRPTIHSGLSAPPGRSSSTNPLLPTYTNASRLITQPAFAARDGILYLAWSNSTHGVFGVPNPNSPIQSNVLFMRSDDGGASWTAPVQVDPSDPSVATDLHHVLPALAIDTDPNDVHISYYTQHSDGTVDVDMANSHDRGDSFPAERTLRLTSTAFALAPTNVLLSQNAMTKVSNTTNYDRSLSPCYSLGEYNSVTVANGTVYAVWGDSRITITHPVNALDPLSGKTHPQQDVFFQAVKAQ